MNTTISKMSTHKSKITNYKYKNTYKEKYKKKIDHTFNLHASSEKNRFEPIP